MKEADLAKELKSGTPAGLYFFWGDEDYLKNRRTAEMKKAVLGGDGSFDAFNCFEMVFGDGEFDEGAAEDALLAPPMMGLGKFISLTFSSVDSLRTRARAKDALPEAPPDDRDEDRSGDAPKDAKDAKDAEDGERAEEREKSGKTKNRLLEFLKSVGDPGPDTVVVVKAVSGGFDGGTEKKPSPFVREAEKFMKVVEFPYQPEARLIRWMERHFAEFGLSPEPDVCPWILRAAGRSMYRLSGELTKTAAFALARIEKQPGSPRTVTLRDAEECVTASDEDDAFALANSVMSGDTAGALRSLRMKMARREEPVLILGQVSRSLTDLYAAAAFAADGKTAAEYAEAMKMHPYPAGLRYRAASRRSPALYADALSLCLAADRQLKSGVGGGTGNYAPIERLICQLAAVSGSGTAEGGGR